MTTPTTLPITDVILAIDLGRYKSVACLYDPATRAAQFRTLDTGRADFERLFRAHPGVVVVVEAGSNAGWAVDLPDPATRQRRALIAHRQALVGRRTATQNRIRAVFAGQGLPSPRGHRAWTATGLDGLDLQAKPLADCASDELWRGVLHLALADYRHLLALIDQAEAALDRLAAADPATRLLETAPGVGPRTAEAVAAHLGDPKRFATGKQIGAFAGLVPRQYQSGESDRKGRITRRGPSVLRKLLVECAWAALRYNAWARATYARLTRGGVTRKKPAIVALARRLLVRLWAMLRDGTPWRTDPQPAAT
jgi:transposase